MRISYHPWSHNLSLTCGTYHCGGNVENAVEERDNRDLKETRCHSWKIVFKEMIQFGLMHPPFWFSMLETKKAMLILLEGNIEDHYLKEASSHLLNSHT